MGALLAIALIAYVMTRAVSDARIDHTYAKQGLVSPRLEARYGGEAKAKTSRYGMFAYFADAWSDHWQRRAAALEADREAYLANPGERVRLRDRLARAREVMAAAGRKFVEPVPTWTERQPAEVVDKPAESELAPIAVETGDVPVGTIRHTDTGREQWDGSEWQSTPEASAEPPTRETPNPTSNDTSPAPGGAMSSSTKSATCSCCQRETWAGDISGHPGVCGLCRSLANPSCVGCRNRRDAAQRSAASWSATPAEPLSSATVTTTGGTVTAPGLEATNFETAVPALDALTAATQNLSDHVAGAKAAATQFHDHVDEVDQARRAVEEAATLVMEQLAARNLDADTMGSVTSAMEMIRAGDLSAAMDHIDAAAAKLAAAESAAAEASGAAAAASQTVVAKYGDAANTVASELSGDASFLHSGGGTGAGGGSGAATAATTGGATAGGAPRPGSSGGGIHVTDGDISYTGVIGGGGNGGGVSDVAGKPSGGGLANNGVQHFGTGEINVGSGSVIGDHATVTNS